MKKKLLNSNLWFIMLLFSIGVSAQGNPVFTNLEPESQTVTITNIGDASIDIENYQLCTDGFRYDPISSLTTDNTLLPAGGTITFTWNDIPTTGSGTLIMFTNRSFGSSDPNILRDYVRWGSSNFRINQGVNSGRWNSIDATIECPAPYTTNGTRGGSPEGWGVVADGGTVAIDLAATGNPNGTTSFNGDLEAVICIDSQSDPIVVTHNNSPGAVNLSYRYVITDAETGLILNVVNTNSIDLNGVEPGTCQIWGWSYRGVPGNGLDQIGEPLSSLDDLDCSDISDNAVTIIREAADGGTVSIDLDATGNPNGTTSFNGDTEAVICIDSLADPIVVVHENESPNLSYRYVITDAETGLILNVVNTNSIDLNGVAPGSCQIWGWSYRNVPGNGLDQIGEPLSSLDDLDCSDISDNAVTIIREAADGGNVSIDLDATGNPNGTTSFNGDTEAVICIDSLADPIVVVHENESPNLSYRYVITDAETGLILNVVNTNSIDLNGVAPGSCQIWGWSYRNVPGNGLDQIGEPLSSLDDLDCSDISDNAVTIIREEADGGTVSIDLDATGNPNGTTSFNGDTEAVICIDSLADPIVVIHENESPNLSYRYVITDAETGLILNVVNTNSIDLNGVAPGTCQIWGWSYRNVPGNGLDQVGLPLSSLDDLDCSDISDNAITIIREAADGGTVSIDLDATDAIGESTTIVEGSNSATITVGDVIANPIVVTHINESSNLSYRYVITDAETGLILNVVNTNSIDLDGVAPGTCQIWGWSYRNVPGNGLDQVGLPLSSLDDLDCSDISDNQITVVREEVVVSSEVILTAIDPVSDVLTITNIGNLTVDIGNYQLCTDGFRYNAVNELRGIGGEVLDTELSAGESITLVWNEVGAVNGNDNATLILFSNPNFESSNPDDLLDYVRWGSSNFRINQGVNSGRWNSLDATIECPAPYTTNGTRGGSPEGWGVVADGGTVAIDLAATGNPNGTTSFNGDLEAVICIDSQSDPIVVTHNNSSGAVNLSYRYVITDAETGLILNVVNTNSIDLNAVAPGTCQIWGWSYRGVPGNGLDQVGLPLSSLDDLDCSDISDNAVTIIREAADGGNVSIDLDATGNPNGTTSFNGDTEAVICIDSLADPIVVIHENESPNLSYRYVITDAETGLILNVVNTNSIDLNGVAPGTCQIWGWAYRNVPGNGLDQVGLPLSSLDDLDCSDISDNAVTIIREAADGGTVSIDLDATGNPNGTTSFNGDTEAVICIDSLADPIVVIHENESPNLSYRYVITDAETGLILNVVNTNSIDLNGVAPGTCQIWGWSYRNVPGNGLDQVGLPLSSLDDLDCSDISDNAVTIIREAADGGTVSIDLDATGNPNGTTSFNGDTEAVICIDSLADPIVVIHENESPNLSYRYVITDAETGLILNVVNTNSIDLNGVAPGTCQIWGWSYRNVPGNGLDQVGLPLSSLDDLDCSDISDNAVTIIREAADGGTVSIDLDATDAIGESTTIVEGSNSATITVGDDIANPIVVTHINESPNLSYRYVITDAETGLILNVVNTNNIDLDGVAPGTCQIWGWSYRNVPGNGLDQVGLPLSSLDDLDCSDISDDFIEVIRADEVLSVEDNQISVDVSIFPNPTTSFLNISLAGVSNGYSINVYSVTGQLVRKSTYTTQENTLDVSTLNSGMYLLEVIDANSNTRIVKRFMKR